MNIKLYTNNVLTHELNLLVDGHLLDALMHIVHNHLKFDYIIVDDNDKISSCQFRKYVQTINDFCRRMNGWWYDNLEAELLAW